MRSAGQNIQKTGPVLKKPTSNLGLKKLEPTNVVEFKGVKTIKMAIKQAHDLDRQLKEFSDKLKTFQGFKVKLILKTIFENDAALLQLQIKLFKTMVQSISYLEWNIQGNFTDDGQAKAIGDIIGRLPNLYSLSLSIHESYFADRGAASLAVGLSKLKKLHCLHLEIHESFGKICIKLSEKGINQILKVISNLPELEILFHNLLGSEDYPYPPKLASMNYSMKYRNHNFKEMIDVSPVNLHKETKQYIDERKQFITELYLENDFYDEYDTTKEDLKSFEDLMNLSFELPYLTKFDVELYEVNTSQTRIFMTKKIITGLAESRLSMVMSLLVIQSAKILDFLPFNPKLVFVDLMFE